MSLLKHVYMQFNNVVFYDCVNIRGPGLNAQSEFGIPVVPIQSKRDGFSFLGSGPFNVGESAVSS